jgi:hypothetical protein
MRHFVLSQLYGSHSILGKQTGRLSPLVDEGMLMPEGETRGRWYESSPLLDEIYKRNYERRTNVDPFTQEGLPFPAESMTV